MRRSFVTVAAAMALGIGILGVSPASADHPTSAVTPTEVPGNPTCDDIDGLEFDLAFKLDPVPGGLTSHPITNGVSDEITLDVNDPIINSFSIDGAVAVAVLVKGGPNANLYDYRPDGVSGDVDLHAPDTPGGPPAGLSHVEFCLVGAPPPPPPPPDDDDDEAPPAPVVEVEPVFTG